MLETECQKPILNPGQNFPGQKPLKELWHEIRRLLVTEKSEVFLKKLFGEKLAVGNVNEAIPLAVLPAEKRQNMEGCKILGRAGGINICYVHLRVSHVSALVEGPIINALKGIGSASLVIFTNYRETEHEFCWLSPAFEVRAFPLQKANGLKKLTHLIGQLSTAVPRNAHQFSQGELVRRWDLVFSRLVPRRRSARSALNFLKARMREYPVLKAHEEKKLFQQWQFHGDPNARLRLINSNLRLVVWVAGRFRGKGLEAQDLFQEGCLGLLRAIQYYDPSLGVKFATFAIRLIRQTILQAIQTKPFLIRISKPLQELEAKWKKAEEKLWAIYHGVPASAEINQVAGLTSRQLRKFFQARAAMNPPIHNALVLSEICAPDQHGSAEDLEYLKRRIESALRALPYRSAEILRRHYGLGDDQKKWTYQKLGQMFNLSRERVRQIHTRALEQMRFHLQGSFFKDQEIF